MATMLAPGLKPSWIREERLAVSPMPRMGEEEKIASLFNTVVSLSPPGEHIMSMGYDPRTLQQIKPEIRIIWRPIGEYNAPSLVELIKTIREARREPILVHCFRGCGRSSVVALAWLMYAENMSLPEARAEISSRTGCSIETAPQLGVVEAFDLARRARVLDKLYKEYDVDDPLPEYLLLLSRSLAPFLGEEPERLAEEMLDSRDYAFIASIAELLSRRLDYKIARIYSERDSLVLLVWIPRRAHPSNVRGDEEDYSDLVKEIEEIASQALDAKKPRVILRRYYPSDIPWLEGS